LVIGERAEKRGDVVHVRVPLGESQGALRARVGQLWVEVAV
jgi:hypothetical protein